MPPFENTVKGFNFNITLLMAFDMVKNIVERFGPEHRATNSDNTGCVYAVERDGILVPVCIVGQLFADLGMLRVLVSAHADLAPSLSNSPTDESCETVNLCGIGGSMAFKHLSERFGITVDPDAQVFLQVCQSLQDDDHTWLNAFERASEVLIRDGYVTPAAATARDQVWAALNV